MPPRACLGGHGNLLPPRPWLGGHNICGIDIDLRHRNDNMAALAQSARPRFLNTYPELLGDVRTKLLAYVTEMLSDTGPMPAAPATSQHEPLTQDGYPLIPQFDAGKVKKEDVEDSIRGYLGAQYST